MVIFSLYVVWSVISSLLHSCQFVGLGYVKGQVVDPNPIALVTLSSPNSIAPSPSSH